MPSEKKKVNLVHLKTKFGHFLNKHYSCNSCHSMDKLVFGFTCQHRLCTNCNGNFTDQCKLCDAEIENADQDGFQSNVFPCLEGLKNIMAIDLAKVASKLKLQQSNGVQEKPRPVEDAPEQEADVKANEENQPRDEQAAKEDANPDENQDKNQNEKKEPEQTAFRSPKSPRRQSKRERKSTEKANESKKNSSMANESKKNNSVEQPAQNGSVNEPEVVAAASESKAVRIRELSRSKEPKKDRLDDSIKESSIEKQPKIEKSAVKSTRKATKAAEVAKSPQITIISTSITDVELSLLKKFAKRFNAKIVNEFSDDITHLVTLEAKGHPNLTTRTLKYLKSLLSHKWLLNFNWIRSSLDNDELANESDFELLGITKQTDDQLGAPKRSRENPTGLFEGKQFYIDGKFGPKSGLPKTDYRDLVVVGGGEVIESEKNVQDDTYIIIDAATLSKSKYKDRANAVSTTNFLNCVSDFRFPN